MHLFFKKINIYFRLCSAGRYEVDGYVYNSAEEPKILMTGKWNTSLSYQPCDLDGEPLPGTDLKEVMYFDMLLFIELRYAIWLPNVNNLMPYLIVPNGVF